MTAAAPWPAWQSIESAPRDGTRVLLWDPLDTEWVPGRWSARDGVRAASWRHCPGGWPIAAEHWLPLPPAPEQGGGE